MHGNGNRTCDTRHAHVDMASLLVEGDTAGSNERLQDFPPAQTRQAGHLRRKEFEPHAQSIRRSRGRRNATLLG